VVNWSQWGPTILALVGIPLAAFLAWWRERDLKDVQHDRDEAHFRETQNREDRLRREQQEREDHIRQEQLNREDQIRRGQQQREDDLARVRFDDWASQQWWERKAAAYTQIIETLWRMFEYARDAVEDFYDEIDAHYDVDEGNFTEEERQRRVAEKQKKWKPRGERFQQDREELKKVVGIGAFVISEDAISLLEVYFKRTLEADELDPDDQAEEYHKAAEDCLANVRAAAMRDLHLSPKLNPQ
jgi:hypothetical protein